MYPHGAYPGAELCMLYLETGEGSRFQGVKGQLSMDVGGRGDRALRVKELWYLGDLSKTELLRRSLDRGLNLGMKDIEAIGSRPGGLQYTEINVASFFFFLSEEHNLSTYICAPFHHQTDLTGQSDGAPSPLRTPPRAPADSPLLLQLEAPAPPSLGPLIPPVASAWKALFTLLLAIGQPCRPFRFLFRGAPLQEACFPHSDNVGSCHGPPGHAGLMLLL